MQLMGFILENLSNPLLKGSLANNKYWPYKTDVSISCVEQHLKTLKMLAFL